MCRSTRAAPGGSRRASCEYSFDFDDGREENQTAPEIRHAYRQPGKYTIRVTVTDPRWGTSTAGQASGGGAVMGILAWITLLPIAGAALVMLIPREEEALHRGVGFGTALVTFVVSLFMLGDFDAAQSGSTSSTRSGSSRSASTSSSASTASRCGWCC